MAKKTGSTLSRKVELSQRSQDVIDLGNRIVEELGLQEGVDTLAKWMAHYLAELILQASKERTARKRKILQARCCVTIERLWKNRATLPKWARPLGRLESQLAAIEMMMQDFGTGAMIYRHAAEDTTDPWLVFATASHSIDRRMSAIALLTSFLEIDFGRETRWVAEHSRKLSKQERKLIRSLDGWLEKKHDFFSGFSQESVSSLPAKERNDRILEELNKALQAQQAAYSALRKSVQLSRPDLPKV